MSQSRSLERECPVCNETVGNLPSHLRHQCEGTQEDDDDIQNSHDEERTWVSEKRCRDWREAALDGRATQEIAEESNRSKPTVTRHLTGECSHSQPVGPLRWSQKTRRWIRQ